MWYHSYMENKRTRAAAILFAVPSTDRFLVLSLMRQEGLISDGTLDRAYRGQGNAAARRQGVDTSATGCGCAVCVEYGGDCSYQLWREGHDEWHAARRGVKTRLARKLLT